jgi:hypothetical protein
MFRGIIYLVDLLFETEYGHILPFKFYIFALKIISTLLYQFAVMSKNTPVNFNAIFSSKFNNQQDLESKGPFKQRKMEDFN